jgi:hypothetical protein
MDRRGVRFLRLRRRRSRVPGMYLIYHAHPGHADELGAAGAAAMAAPDGAAPHRSGEWEDPVTSVVALTAEECRDVEW